MTEFRGDQFYNEKLANVLKIFEGMNASESFTLSTGMICRLCETFISDKDLEFSRQILSIMRTGIIDELSERGWE